MRYENMYKPKLEKDIRCPLDYGRDTFAGKWKSRIICVLSKHGTMRYNSLRKELTNITDAVLSSTLKELVRDGIVLRKQFDEIPPRVEYCLTEKGESVIPILISICEWSGARMQEDATGTQGCQACDYSAGGATI